ncbi:TraR/DksA family transcriptional regulator [Microbacterium flavescens]|jgi:DnaK suppressor protein|uniref:TraR/DksA family transcriptional regulator n=1 Tax=Microbacterium flavescens TaxID=69366 RepID=UPI001BDE870D|nr:TraR/DksA C4-type zinc finger protein [Microbacterium flavescens]
MITDTSIQPTSAPDLDIESIRVTLETELTRREEVLRELAPRAIPSVDPATYMTAQATRRVVDQIRASLDRIAEGTYGRCIRCGAAIVAARLEVLPYAETCIDCQNDVERS